MRTLLLVDYHFPPLWGSGAQRTLGFLRHLSRHGWQPIVLTVEDGDQAVRDSSLLEEIPEAVSVQRTRSLEPVRILRRLAKHSQRSKPGGGENGPPVRRGARWLHGIERWVLFPDRQIGWFPFAVRSGLAIASNQRPDAIYSTSTSVTSHLVAYRLSRELRVPWVADFQDPWLEGFAIRAPSTLHNRLAIKLEKLIATAADAITVTTEFHRRLLQRKYPEAASKVFVIPMGLHPEAFQDLTRETRERFTMAYFGSFYGPRSAGPFLRGLAAASKTESMLAAETDVILYGTFDAPARVEAEGVVLNRGLERMVRLPGPVSHKVAVQSMMSSHVLLLITDGGWWGRNLVPAKLFEYLATGRPILAIVPEGATSAILQEVGGSIIVDPADAEKIGEAICSLYRKWKAGNLHMGNRRLEALARFAWQARTDELASVLERIVRGAEERV